MATRYYTFTFRRTPENFELVVKNKSFGPGWPNEAPEIEIVGHWPRGKYSFEKALSRADRYVGQFIRELDPRDRVYYALDIALIQVAGETTNGTEAIQNSPSVA